MCLEMTALYGQVSKSVVIHAASLREFIVFGSQQESAKESFIRNYHENEYCMRVNFNCKVMLFHEFLQLSTIPKHLAALAMCHVNVSLMGNLHYRLNFDPGKTNKIFHHSSKEHVKISRTAKFACEML